jgi:hypothetical protein
MESRARKPLARRARMVNFDKELVERILVEELGRNKLFVGVTIKALSNLDERLQGVLGAWIKDRTETDYTFEGISIRQIMEKEECTFLDALSSMSTFVSHPESIKDYQKLRFTRRFKGNPFKHCGKN